MFMSIRKFLSDITIDITIEMDYIIGIKMIAEIISVVILTFTVRYFLLMISQHSASQSPICSFDNTISVVESAIGLPLNKGKFWCFAPLFLYTGRALVAAVILTVR